MSQSTPSTTLVIFGVSGDLSKRKLLPALSEICQSSDIKANLRILGLSRSKVSSKDVLPKDAKNIKNQFETMQLDYANPQEFQSLKKKIEEYESSQVIFYFAVPPETVLPIIEMLGNAQMNQDNYKLLMEKPFGTNLATAIEMITQINRYFKEPQVYRIDHFLAKEMAQNISVFLGSNAIFRDVWNNKYIERIEVVAEESIGIEGRAHFYEQTGALRDIVQSHLLQLVALTLMEPCTDIFDYSEMRAKRLAALNKLKVIPKSVLKAQYNSYKSEVNNQETKIETFVALDLKSNHPNWANVPIKLLTGKKLKEKLTEVRVYFKPVKSTEQNLLRIRVQPREGIELELWVKKPGYDQQLQKLPLDFSFNKHFDRLPDAYEQVIVDAIRSRANLFASSQEVIASWKILQPVLEKWDKYKLKTYTSGSTTNQILG